MPPSKVFARDLITRNEISFIKKNISRENFSNWIFNNYKSLRCYHAGRPKDLNSYYDNGFLPSNLTKMVEDFHELLKNVNFKGKVDIEETIKVFDGRSNRFIYLILDKDDFIHQAQHYWIYGSEFMFCLAQNTAYHLKDYLRNTGIPTIFTCDIPISTIDSSELINLFERIKNAKGTLNQMLNDIFTNYTIIIENHIHPDCIIDHEHPTERVYDFHTEGYYQNQIRSCLFCK